MLILICGLPRAGKTTYAKNYKNVIHLDDYIHLPMALRYEKCAKQAETEETVVVEGIYHKTDLRIKLLNAYKGEKTKCIWLDTPTEIKRRRNGFIPAMDFPFEPPTTAEGWDEIIVIR